MTFGILQRRICQGGLRLHRALNDMLQQLHRASSYGHRAVSIQPFTCIHFGQGVPTCIPTLPSFRWLAPWARQQRTCSDEFLECKGRTFRAEHVCQRLPQVMVLDCLPSFEASKLCWGLRPMETPSSPLSVEKLSKAPSGVAFRKPVACRPLSRSSMAGLGWAWLQVQTLLARCYALLRLKACTSWQLRVRSQFQVGRCYVDVKKSRFHDNISHCSC